MGMLNKLGKGNLKQNEKRRNKSIITLEKKGDSKGRWGVCLKSGGVNNHYIFTYAYQILIIYNI